MQRSDTFDTSDGPLTIQPIHHASLVLQFKGLTLYCDPVGGARRYAELKRPDLIVLTHEHSDHLDPATLTALAGPATTIIGANSAVSALPGPLRQRAASIAHGQSRDFEGITIRAVPAHNLTPERLRYHPKGIGNGYVLGFGDTTVYIAGDTEDTPEMRQLRNIDVAFLPMNLPYTMTGAQAADAARAFRPKIVYPFHYLGGAENAVFAEELADDPAIDVRLRNWYEGD